MATHVIPPDTLTILRYKRARRRAAAFNAAHPRPNPAPRRNPYVGSHPDLFGASTLDQYPRRPGPTRRGKDGSDLEHELHGPLPRTAAARAKRHAGPDSPVFVPLSDLTSEQIRDLKREQFTDEEWDEIDEDDAEHIIENDEQSQARVDLLADVFIKRWKWETEIDPNARGAFERVEDFFEEVVREKARTDKLYEWLPTQRYKALVRHAEGRDLDETDVDAALNSIMADTNQYHFTFDRHDRNGPVIYEQDIEGYVYVESEDWEEYVAMCTPDEVERAIKKIKDDTNHDIVLKVEDLTGKRGYVETHFETGNTAYVLLETESVVNDCEESLTSLADERDAEMADETDPPNAPAAEDRVVYRWPDGFYVLDLLPSELAAEGKAMGMCVGRPDMGYGRAVREGEIKILSVRRPSGKPLFTIEAVVSQRSYDPDNKSYKKTVITGLEQVKGKANRLPGFDLGKTAPGTPIKKDEVTRIYELLEDETGRKMFGNLAVDDVRDLKPAAREVNRLYREGDKWAIDLFTRFGIEGSQVASWRVGADEPRQNPGPACGRHGEGCTGFCAPYRRRR